MAEEFVKENLKSPSTAKFGSVWDGTLQSPEERVWSIGPNKFRVTGWVEAQNSFGAVVRSNFVCELEYDGYKYWTCTSIVIL